MMKFIFKYIRVLWLFLTVASILSGILVTWQALKSIEERPYWTLADSPNNPIWNYKFPAVTVCNFNKISRVRANKFAKSLVKPSNLTTEDLAWNLRLLYYLTDFSFTHSNFTMVQEVLDANNVDIEYLMQYLAPSCSSVFQRCKWKGLQVSCGSLFEQIKTPYGFCCSFNYFAIKNHAFGNSTDKALRAPKSARKVSATGHQTALEVIINTSSNDYFASEFSSYGYQIIIHNSDTYPDGDTHTLLHCSNNLDFITITPTLFTTDDRLKDLSFTSRNCALDGEAQLENLRYTYYNCITECRIRLILSLCNCIPYFYNTKNRNSNGIDSSISRPRICDLEHNFCLAENKHHFHTSIPESTNDLENKSCECYPDCYYCYYSVEQYTGSYRKQYDQHKPTLLERTQHLNESEFGVFFNDLIGTRYTTFNRFYWHNALGFLGGVMSLASGFSVVVAIKLVYLGTVRPIIYVIGKMWKK